MGRVVSEVLDEALEGEGLTDSIESLSVAPRPFTWEHTHSSSTPLHYILISQYSDIHEYYQHLQESQCDWETDSLLLMQYQSLPQGGNLGFELLSSIEYTLLRGPDEF